MSVFVTKGIRMRLNMIANELTRDAHAGSPIGKSDCSSPARPIRIQTFGGLAVTVAERPMMMRARTPQKELDLLSALVTYGPPGVDFKSLAMTVWPDADDGAARNCCAVTVNRLRRRLGHADAVILCNNRMRLDAMHVSVDAWDFGEVIGKWDTAMKGDAAEAEIWTSRLFDLYVGEFIPENDRPFVLGAREQFRGRFRRALRQWGALLKRTGRWDAAIQYYKRATEVSPLEETFYLELMECYQALGATGDALRIFEQIRTLLLAHYGIAPSPALQTKRAQLRS